jgi:hypothetical protein
MCHRGVRRVRVKNGQKRRHIIYGRSHNWHQYVPCYSKILNGCQIQDGRHFLSKNWHVQAIQLLSLCYTFSDSYKITGHFFLVLNIHDGCFNIVKMGYTLYRN